MMAPNFNLKIIIFTFVGLGVGIGVIIGGFLASINEKSRYEKIKEQKKHNK